MANLQDPEQFLARLAPMLRDDGLSFEEIAVELSTEQQLAGRPRGYTVGEVYAACNPNKSAAQIARWQAKHDPAETKQWS
jgi:hypothetical protein